MKALIPLLVLSTALSGLSQPAPATDEATQAINMLREELVSSFTKGDVDGLLRNVDPDVLVTWQNGEVCLGRDAVRAFYDRMMKGDKRVVREIKSAPEVVGRQVNGDWALSWGTLHDHFLLNDGSDLPFNSAFTAVVAKRDDRWMVKSFHTSVNAFDNAVLALAVRKTATWVGVGAGVIGAIIGFVIGRRKRA